MGNLGWFGLAGSLVSASFLFSALISSMNQIFRTKYHKSFFYNRLMEYVLMVIVGGAVIALAVIAGAICQAKAISAGCEGISRNPGGAPHIRFLLVFGLVLIETLVIYALLITIIILMVQWNKYPGI